VALKWDPELSNSRPNRISTLRGNVHAAYNVEAFDRIFSYCFVFCPPGVAMLLITDVALRYDKTRFHRP
jgi:hypothetical protein